MVKLKQLDVVRTKFGTIAVVAEVTSDGRGVSLVLPVGSKQKAAWYGPEELTRIASVEALVDSTSKTDVLK